VLVCVFVSMSVYECASVFVSVSVFVRVVFVSFECVLVYVVALV
jgi:hypothetical protein